MVWLYPSCFPYFTPARPSKLNQLDHSLSIAIHELKHLTCNRQLPSYSIFNESSGSVVSSNDSRCETISSQVVHYAWASTAHVSMHHHHIIHLTELTVTALTGTRKWCNKQKIKAGICHTQPHVPGSTDSRGPLTSWLERLRIFWGSNLHCSVHMNKPLSSSS